MLMKIHNHSTGIISLLLFGPSYENTNNLDFQLGPHEPACLNLNSLLVTRQMTLFHQGVWMGEKLVP